MKLPNFNNHSFAKSNTYLIEGKKVSDPGIEPMRLHRAWSQHHKANIQNGHVHSGCLPNENVCWGRYGKRLLYKCCPGDCGHLVNDVPDCLGPLIEQHMIPDLSNIVRDYLGY